MATSSSSCFTLLDMDHNKSQNIQLTHKNGGECLFLCRETNLQLLQRSAMRKSSSNKVSIVRKATPEAAEDLLSSSTAVGGDLLSSFSLPTIPDFPDAPWITGIAGLLVAVPFMIQRLLTLTKEVDMAAETVEKIADTVGKVAEEVDKAAEDIAEALPEGGLKKVVSFVEDLAEETAKDAQKVEDLMDKLAISDTSQPYTFLVINGCDVSEMTNCNKKKVQGQGATKKVCMEKCKNTPSSDDKL